MLVSLPDALTPNVDAGARRCTNFVNQALVVVAAVVVLVNHADTTFLEALATDSRRPIAKQLDAPTPNVVAGARRLTNFVMFLNQDSVSPASPRHLLGNADHAELN
jgi:hypothetical protein